MLPVWDASSLTTKSRRRNFRLQIFKKSVSSIYLSYWEYKDYKANSVNIDEVAHFESPRQDLRCLQIQIFLSLVLLKRV